MTEYQKLTNPQADSRPVSVHSQAAGQAFPSASSRAHPLTFWANIRMHAKYPRLHRAALGYFAMSGTSVPSERLFSLASSIMTKKRTRLASASMDMLVTLSANLAFFPEEIVSIGVEKIQTEDNAGLQTPVEPGQVLSIVGSDGDVASTSTTDFEGTGGEAESIPVWLSNVDLM